MSSGPLDSGRKVGAGAELQELIGVVGEPEAPRQGG